MIEEFTKQQFDDVVGSLPYRCRDKGWNTRNLKWTVEEISQVEWNLKKKKKPMDGKWLNSIYYWGTTTPIKKRRKNTSKKNKMKVFMVKWRIEDRCNLLEKSTEMDLVKEGWNISHAAT